jgi:uncharacterized membrane protein
MHWWTWRITVRLLIAIMGLADLGRVAAPADEEAAMPAHAQRFAAAEGFEAARDIVLGRCSMCHAREPVYDGIHRAPKGILLETDADIAALAQAIYVHSGVSDAMPPANVSWMEDEERAQIVAWFKNGS